MFQYPFSAIVEQNALKTALLLNAVEPWLQGDRHINGCKEDSGVHGESGRPVSDPSRSLPEPSRARNYAPWRKQGVFDAAAQKQDENAMSGIARIRGASVIRMTDLTAASVLKGVL